MVYSVARISTGLNHSLSPVELLITWPAAPDAADFSPYIMDPAAEVPIMITFFVELILTGNAFILHISPNGRRFSFVRTTHSAPRPPSHPDTNRSLGDFPRRACR